MTTAPASVSRTLMMLSRPCSSTRKIAGRGASRENSKVVRRPSS